MCRTSPLESQPLPPTLVAGLGFGDGAGALGRGHDAQVTGGGSIGGRSRLRSSVELTAGDLCLSQFGWPSGKPRRRGTVRGCAFGSDHANPS